jgi:hypothetical protein
MLSMQQMPKREVLLMSSRILTEEQIESVEKARLLVDIYKNPSTGRVSCSDCALKHVQNLLEVVDALNFELDQLNK